MMSFVSKLYDWFQVHRTVRGGSLIVLTAIFFLLIFNQSYKEDISDFLPLNNKYQKALGIYQNMSGADRILTIFQCEDTTNVDPDYLVEAIERYLTRLDTLLDSDVRNSIVAQVDIERYSEVTDFTYQHVPYFLTENDYLRLDSLMADDSYVQTQIRNAKQMLMFPVFGLLAENLQRDPLNIFTPIVSLLQPSEMDVDYELYDGYIFSSDLKRAIVSLNSPYGASETDKNATLLSLLEKTAHETEKNCQGIKIRYIGGPVIAVGNSKQIKYDSIFSIILAVALIVALLFGVFRNFRNIFLIVLSISWGWLFAMGLLALMHDNVSVIVIGISSVILGIAVNYPLHLIVHADHTPDIKSALKEIVMPLVVGNITTVGAFLALVPLKSIALRDLGLFSSFLLVGTIFFVLIYLPHYIRSKHPSHHTNFISRIGEISFDNKRWLVWGIIILTVILGYFSFDTSFDANMNHINYMTEEQREDFSSLQKMLAQNSSDQKLFVVSSDSTLEGALLLGEKLHQTISKMQEQGELTSVKDCYRFLPSTNIQQHRLELWNKFVDKYASSIILSVSHYAVEEGFAPETFEPFFNLLKQIYVPLQPNEFGILQNSAFASHVVYDKEGGLYNVINTLTTDEKNVALVEEKFDNISESQFSFDVESMNSSIATSISDDFNYIGWACGLIVFFFLWFSLGSIELAMLSFLPMALSWVWILGIMAILHIHFNVVNVILATFIFGQGDDYTIFMTEGCQYEYAYRKKMLSSYKSSIIISALIMFIGIGTLITARHPALHSLAEVTIVGMFSVVLMAYIFPPLIYKWMVMDNHCYRIRPFSLPAFFVTFYCGIIFFTQLASVYILGLFLFVLRRPTKTSKEFFHKYIQKCFWFDIHRIASVKFALRNPFKEAFDQPSIIVCNHQSMLDTAYLMALSHKIVIVANENASQNKVIKPIFKWMDNYSLSSDERIDNQRISKLLNNGYSVVIFPEGQRNPLSSILRFHKGAFYLAELNGVDIIPIMIHGANQVFPRNTFCTYSGAITIAIGQRIKANDKSWGNSYVNRTRSVHHYFIDEYEKLCKEKEDAAYFQRFIEDRYRYKGIEIFSTIKKRLKQHHGYAEWIDAIPRASCGCCVVLNSQFGEFALLFALTHPRQKVYAIEQNCESYRVSKYSAEGVAKNLIPYSGNIEEIYPNGTDGSDWMFYLLNPSHDDETKYAMYNPIVIK